MLWGQKQEKKRRNFLDFWFYEFAIFAQNWFLTKCPISKVAKISVPLNLKEGSQVIFGNGKPSKRDEKCFLFHHKSFFRFEDI